MYLQPIDLKGKTIKEAYTVYGGTKDRLIIEFLDGVKIELFVDTKNSHHNGRETIIRQIL